MYIKISIYICVYSFACENIVYSSPQQRVNSCVCLCMSVFVIRKQLNERKENENKNKEKTYISCAHARVHICMFHCPNRKRNIINGFRNIVRYIANDRTKTICVQCSCFEFDKVTLQQNARVTLMIFNKKKWMKLWVMSCERWISLTERVLRMQMYYSGGQRTQQAKLVSSIDWIVSVLSFWMNAWNFVEHH